MSNGPVENTDRELWRERPGDYYADSVHVTKDGRIGMNSGGYVVTMPIRMWVALIRDNKNSQRFGSSVAGNHLPEPSRTTEGSVPAAAESLCPIGQCPWQGCICGK